jgi:hypothetical protein
MTPNFSETRIADIDMTSAFLGVNFDYIISKKTTVSGDPCGNVNILILRQSTRM